MTSPSPWKPLLDQLAFDESRTSRRIEDLVWPEVCQTPDAELKFRAIEAALRVYGIEMHPTIQ